MARPLPDRPLGVYIHFPYCTRLCPYCDFAVVVRPQIDHEGYLSSVLNELERRSGAYAGAQLQSIYFGGGTPGLWDGACLARVIGAVRAKFPGGSDLEITVEANPEHVDAQTVAAWRAGGVNRLSLGVQSFDGQILDFLGRRHSPEDAHFALKTAFDGGIENISLDLIFGAEGQTRAGFAEELAMATAQPGIRHISLYQLTIEPQTVFGRLHKRGKLAAPDVDLGADLFDDAKAALLAAGFEHYEVSNYGKKGYHSRHNSLYWRGAEYLGLGIGAHSLLYDGAGQILRRGNGRDLKTYLKSPENLDFEVENLDEITHLGERLFTGLRTQWGVDLTAVQSQFDRDISPLIDEKIDALIGGGFLRRAGQRIIATEKGLRLGDWVAEQFIALD